MKKEFLLVDKVVFVSICRKLTDSYIHTKMGGAIYHHPLVILLIRTLMYVPASAATERRSDDIIHYDVNKRSIVKCGELFG